MTTPAEQLYKVLRQQPRGDVSLSRELAESLLVQLGQEVPTIQYPQRGEGIVVYEGMGEYSLGIALAADPLTDKVSVLIDGYMEPDGTRHEPYAMVLNAASVQPDPNRTESLKVDQARSLPGYISIPATLPEPPAN